MSSRFKGLPDTCKEKVRPASGKTPSLFSNAIGSLGSGGPKLEYFQGVLPVQGTNEEVACP